MWQLNCLPKDITVDKIQHKCRECVSSSDLLKHFDFVLVLVPDYQGTIWTGVVRRAKMIEKKYRRRIRNKNRAIKMELYKSMLLFKCEQDHLNTVL